MEEDLPSKWRAKKKAGVAILASDKIDFKLTEIKRDKEGHYIMVKGSMQQEELTILNIYAPNTEAPRYIKQVLNDLQRDIDSHTIIVGDFNTPLSILDKSRRQKINKDIHDLNSDLDQANLIDIKPTKIKRQRRALHNGKRINATGRVNDPKYILNENRRTQIHKASS